MQIVKKTVNTKPFVFSFDNFHRIQICKCNFIWTDCIQFKVKYNNLCQHKIKTDKKKKRTTLTIEKQSNTTLKIK